MDKSYDSSWDKGNDDAFNRKEREWAKRNWWGWLNKNLTFPFTVKREEDEDDAYFTDIAKREPFRLCHVIEVLNLETEEMDLFVAPRPKRASLVSLANPVRIKGTLAEPKVSVTRIPRGRLLAATGLLAGLVNPAFLIFTLSDIGTGRANSCDASVKRAREISGIDSE